MSEAGRLITQLHADEEGWRLRNRLAIHMTCIIAAYAAIVLNIEISVMLIPIVQEILDFTARV